VAATYKVTNPRKSLWGDGLSEWFILPYETKTGVPESLVETKYFAKAKVKGSLLIEKEQAPAKETKKKTVKKETPDA